MPPFRSRLEQGELDLDGLPSPREDAPGSPNIYTPLSATHSRRGSCTMIDADEATTIMVTPSEHSTIRDSRLDPSRGSMGGAKFDRLLHSNALYETGATTSPRCQSPVTVKRNNFFHEDDPYDSDKGSVGRRGTSRSVLSEGGVGRILSVTSNSGNPRQLRLNEQEEDIASSPNPNHRMRKSSVLHNDWDSDTMGSRVGTDLHHDVGGEGSEQDSAAPSCSEVSDVMRPAAAHRLSGADAAREWVAELRERMASSAGPTPDLFLKEGPKGGLVRCYVLRKKKTFGSMSSYHLYLAESDMFLLAARKRMKTKSSVYVISQSVADLARDSDNCLAKLKANFVGDAYELWGKSDDKSCRKGYGQELLGLSFEQTMLQVAGGPRSMHVVRPNSANWRNEKTDAVGTLVDCLDSAERRELAPSIEKHLTLMATKQPDYDEVRKVHSLDFGGRVKEASVKNFQLVTWDHNADKNGDTVLLQFGKVTADSFILDFGAPFNLHSAFAVALASIDSKLCYSF